MQPEYSYAQYILNPKNEHGIITLADVLNEVKLHVSDNDSLTATTRRLNGSGEDVQASGDLSEKISKLKRSQDENLPRFLDTTLAEHEGEPISQLENENHNDAWKEWKMKEVNPEPILNENKKSVIASFEHIDDEAGFWCTESFTITNRISRLYKGQDSEIYLFSRAGPTSESEWKQGQK